MRRRSIAVWLVLAMTFLALASSAAADGLYTLTLSPSGTLSMNPGDTKTVSVSIAPVNLIELASIQKKCTAEDISSLMLRLGLSPDDRRPVRKYSLGMRQKLGIIQAVMEKPKLVILDKPMNNLDAESIDIVRELISEMQAAYGITTIISSHNVEDIEKLCSRVYKMTNGSLREV